MNLSGNLLPSWSLLRLRPSCSSSRRPKLARMALRAENLGEARAICLDIMATEVRMGAGPGEVIETSNIALCVPFSLGERERRTTQSPCPPFINGNALLHPNITCLFIYNVGSRKRARKHLQSCETKEKCCYYDGRNRTQTRAWHLNLSGVFSSLR